MGKHVRESFPMLGEEAVRDRVSNLFLEGLADGEGELLFTMDVEMQMELRG